MKFRLLAIAIIIFWMLMTYTLVRERVLPYWFTSNRRALPAVTLTQRWEDIEIFDHITYKGKNKGRSAMSITQTDDEQYDVRSSLEFEIALFNAKRKIEWKSRLMLDKSFTLEKFVSRVWIDNLGLDLAGFATDDMLYYKVTFGSNSQYGAFPLSEPISLMEAVGPTIFKSQRLRVGEVYTIPVFDPLWQMEGGEMTLRVQNHESVWHGDEKVMAYRIEATFGNLRTLMWVNEEGEVLRREIMDMLELVRATDTHEIRKMRPMLDPLPFPEFDVEEYKQGLENNRINVQPGIVDMLKGNFNFDDRTQ